MDKDLKDRNIKLERLKVEEEIASKELSISEKKSAEKALRKQYGPNWRKILGLGGANLQDLYNFSPELKGAVRPPRMR